MSQWDSLLKLPSQFKENLMGLYSEDILPAVVRHNLATWIESQNWRLAAKDWSLAVVHLQNLLEHLDIQYSNFAQEQDLLQMHNFRMFKYDIQSLYQEQPQKLAEYIRDILQQEKEILLQAQEMESQNGPQVQVQMETSQQYEVEQRVSKLKERMQAVDQVVKFLEEQQEIFDFRYKTFQRESASNLPEEYLKLKTQKLQGQLNELDQKRREVVSQINELLGLCETLHAFLQQELSAWFQNQKLACIGANTDICLKKLEDWVTKTVEAFFLLRRIVGLLSDLSRNVSYEGDPLKTAPNTLLRRLNEMLCSLLNISFVVDRQPVMLYPCKRPLVLKTSTQFSVRARFLVNLQELKNNMKVKCTIDKHLPNVKGFRRFNLLGAVDKSLEDVQREGLVVDFKHLTLKEQKAGLGKGGKGANDGTLSVIEELHNITFTTQFEYEDVNLTLEAVTLPFVVISNVSQFTGAWASIFWFNLLSSEAKNLTFFTKPPAAPWSLLVDALSWQFSCCTKRGLNTEQRQMLEKKLCGTVSVKENTVTWNTFSKDNMPGLPFTFWVWFDAILTLVKGHLENIWNDGHVMGFVSRNMEDSLLKKMHQGTFLLRFSESIRDGGITCSWVDHQNDGNYTIRSVQPYTKKELSHIPLTEIIRNYQLLAEENIPENPLKYLYPNILKDEAFGKYYEQRNEVTMEYQKYMKRTLIIVSERNIDDSLSCASETPQHCPETPLFEQIPFSDSSLNFEDGVNQIVNGIRFLINENNDPMLSSPQVEYSELSQDLFNTYQ